MTEPLTDSRRSSPDGWSARDTEPPATGDPPRYAVSDREAAREAAPGTPRWVKAFVILFIVLVLGFAGLHLTGQSPTHGLLGHEIPVQNTQTP